MYCRHCKADLPEDAAYCPSCGAQTTDRPEIIPPGHGGGIGYSARIHDPAFARYIKNTNRWAAIFSMILAAAAIIGFYIAGERGTEGMENPQALYIGLGIGGMFLLIALFTIRSRKKSRTWDGVVSDKQIKEKSRQKESGNEYYTQYYTEYIVLIRDENGKEHRLCTEDDDTVFNYYQVGDRVRHHAGLNSYEKYDKSKDSIIFCSACATLCDMNDEVCPRCKCPLLK
ncbi:MAG: hypothetical protein VB086_00810 [Clostridiaceae bacterium]|nr:hypothetical protein [Clostridiaceae bacterium]